MEAYRNMESIQPFLDMSHDLTAKKQAMRIRRAQESDLPEIMAIYARARQFMAEQGNPRQWGASNWPPEDLVREDIQSKKSYVCVKDGELAAVFYFDTGEDVEPAYAEIHDGCWLDESAYGVIHRIASAGTVRGAGTFCIRWAYAQCGHLRIDTHEDNRVMRNLLAKLGFVYCGIVMMRGDGGPRLAYEKGEALAAVSDGVEGG